MALGGAAVLVDRLIIGPPAPLDVPASAIAQLIRPGPEAGGAVPAGPQAAAIPTLVFPRQLPRADLNGYVRDIFAPPHVPVQVPEANPASSTTENSAGFSRAALVAQYRLQAVLWSDGLRIAVINDQWHREGELIGGCRIESIHDREVRVSCPDGAERLILGTPAPRMPH